jgi:Zn-dependent protease
MKFSIKEFGHLGIAAALVVGVGLSFFRFDEIYQVGPLMLTATIIVLTMSFLLHEIAHKLVAQRRGLWAEFRLTVLGAVLTLLSIFSPLFKIISPGAVMISGGADPDSTGRISIAGPAVNIAMCGASLSSAAFFIHNSVVFSLLMVAANLNAWIALFNLIPFGMLDGLKIFSWNKKAWILAFAASIVLMACTYWLSAQV